MTEWDKRWSEWSDDRLQEAVAPRNTVRFKRYAATILRNITPRLTLDIGGGTGQLGHYLPGGYVVMDHPRMEQFCSEGVFVPLGPIGKLYPKPDLAVNTNSWGETSLEVIAGYLREIEEAGIRFLYLNNRRTRQVNFEDFPLQNWSELVSRPFGEEFVEWMGELR